MADKRIVPRRGASHAAGVTWSMRSRMRAVGRFHRLGGWIYTRESGRGSPLGKPLALSSVMRHLSR